MQGYSTDMAICQTESLMLPALPVVASQSVLHLHSHSSRLSYPTMSSACLICIIDSFQYPDMHVGNPVGLANPTLSRGGNSIPGYAVQQNRNAATQSQSDGSRAAALAAVAPAPAAHAPQISALPTALLVRSKTPLSAAIEKVPVQRPAPAAVSDVALQVIDVHPSRSYQLAMTDAKSLSVAGEMLLPAPGPGQALRGCSRPRPRPRRAGGGGGPQ